MSSDAWYIWEMKCRRLLEALSLSGFWNLAWLTKILIFSSVLTKFFNAVSVHWSFLEDLWISCSLLIGLTSPPILWPVNQTVSCFLLPFSDFYRYFHIGNKPYQGETLDPYCISINWSEFTRLEDFTEEDKICSE